MVNLSTREHKKLVDWDGIDFWKYAIEKYRFSKRLRKVIDKTIYRYDYKSYANYAGFDRHYVYQVLKMNIYPNREFVKKLEQLEND